MLRPIMALLALGMFASQSAAGSRTTDPWRLWGCPSEKTMAIERYGDLSSLAEANRLEPGKRYIAGVFVASSVAQSAKVVCDRGTVERVQLEDAGSGVDRLGEFGVALDEHPRMLLVWFMPESRRARPRIEGAVIQESVQLSRDAGTLDLGLQAAARRSGTEAITVSGTLNRPARLFVGDIFLGEAVGHWEHTLDARAIDASVTVTAMDFYGTVVKVVQVPARDDRQTRAVRSERPAPGAELLALPVRDWHQAPGARFLSAPPSAQVRRAIARLPAPARQEPAGSTEIALTLSNEVLDLEHDDRLVITGTFPYKTQWSMLLGDDEIANGFGQGIRVEHLAAQMDGKAGFRTVTVEAGGLSKSRTFLAVAAGDLAVNYSKPVLFSDTTDSIVIAPDLAGAAFTFAIYDRNWYEVLIDSTSDTLVWKGKNSSGKWTTEGVYYCVVTAELGRQTYNSVQTLIVAPRAVFPAPTISRSIARDTLFINDSVLVVAYEVNGKMRVDTVDLGADTLLVAEATRYGAKAFDTLFVVFDTVPPAVAVVDSNVSDDTLVTNDTAVTIAYRVDTTDFTFDTVLTEGTHQIAVSGVDSAGNVTVDTITVVVDLTPPAIVFNDVRLSGDTLFTGDSLVHVTFLVDSLTGQSADTVLGEGTHSVIVTGTDRAGNVTTDTIVVIIDRTPPAVAVTDSNVVDDTLFIRDTSLTVSYQIDGQTLTLDTVLTEGIHEIIVVSRDQAGNIGADTIQVIVSLAPPFPDVTIVSPGVLTTTFRPTFLIRYRDRIATLDTSTLLITLDSVDVTAKFEVTPDSAVWKVGETDALANGSHMLVVSVGNDEGNTTRKPLNFMVSRVIAQPSAYPTSGVTPLEVAFTTKAYDPTGTVEFYMWDFDGDWELDTMYQVPPLIKHTYTRPGTYNAILRVFSNTGQIDTASIQITVLPPKPTAYATAKPTNGGAPLTVGFTGWGASDVGYIKYHAYDFEGDGTYDTSILTGLDTIRHIAATFDTSLEGWTGGGSSGSFGRMTPASSLRKVWSSRDYRSVTSGIGIRGQGGKIFTPVVTVTDQSMLSPAIALPESTTITLRYEQYYNPYSGTSYLEIDTAATDTVFRQLASFSTSAKGDSSVTIDLSRFGGKTARIRFRYNGRISDVNLEGWDVWNILVTSGTTTPDTLFKDVGDGSVVWSTPGKGAEGWRVTETILTPYFHGRGWVEPDTSSYSYGNGFDTWLVSPAVTLQAGLPARLSFWHYLQGSDRADGGMVELSIDGGAFAAIVPDSGYGGTITGTGDGFVDTINGEVVGFDLSAHAGKQIQVRFHFYSNNTNSSARGWLIDNVNLYQVRSPAVTDTLTIYSNAFETVGAVSDWTFGGDSGSPAVFGVDLRADNTDTAWTTSTDSLKRYYVADMSITSPSIAIPPAVGCTLTYWRYFRGGTGYLDVDTGTGFRQVTYWSGFTGATSQSVSLSAYAGKSINLRFRYTGYNGGKDHEGQTIDDILLFSSDGVTRTPLLANSGGPLTGWTQTGYQTYTWVRRPRYVMGLGAGWLELVPDSAAHPDSLNTWAETPPVFLNGRKLMMEFHQYFTSQSSRDGGIVEIRRAGGPYMPLVPVGLYLGTLYSPGVPPYGTSARVYTGDMREDTVYYDLSDYTGSTVQLRFRYISDASNGNGEWIIDNLRIYDSEPASRVVHTYSTAGTRSALFRVTDNLGGTATAPTVLTEIRVGAPGTPSAYAVADTTYGPAPLTVKFTGWGTDPDGSIVSYEWDFDGDGTFDTLVTTEMTITHVYDTVGTYNPVFRVTDDGGVSGNTSRDVLQIVAEFRPTMTVTEVDKSFSPSIGESVGFRTVINGTVTMRMIVVDTAKALVSELVPWGYRTKGTYTDTWSGLLNNGGPDDGEIVDPGLYFAVLEYEYDGDTLTLDLSSTTGGTEAELGQTVGISTATFNPLSDSLLPVTFTLPQASYVTIFTGFYQINKRIRTIYEKELFAAGTYTIYWDGLMDNGRMAPPTPSGGGATVVAGWKYTLPDNAVYAVGTRPTVTFVEADPNYRSPFTQVCAGTPEGIRLSYTVDQAVALVEGIVVDPVTTQVVSTMTQTNVTAGANEMVWEGDVSGNPGFHADAGLYRFGVRATGASGQRSIYRYTLVRIMP